MIDDSENSSILAEARTCCEDYMGPHDTDLTIEIVEKILKQTREVRQFEFNNPIIKYDMLNPYDMWFLNHYSMYNDEYSVKIRPQEKALDSVYLNATMNVVGHHDIDNPQITTKSVKDSLLKLKRSRPIKFKHRIKYHKLLPGNMWRMNCRDIKNEERCKIIEPQIKLLRKEYGLESEDYYNPIGYYNEYIRPYCYYFLIIYE